jgi:L-lysine 6-transaminase
MLVDVVPIIVDLEKSHGNFLVDAVSGEEYLDCFSYIASNPIGHNHPGLKDPEFEQKLLRVAKCKPSNADFYTVEMAEFVDAFARLALPPEFPYVFYIEGGALAVENGLKTAFDWKIRKNQKAGLSSDKGTKVLHFEQAFHGRSGYTLSVTNTADPRKTKYFPKFDWPRVPNPKAAFPLEGANLKETIAREEQSKIAIAEAFKNNPNDIAAILVEPIQGEGGDNHFRPEFHQFLRETADREECLLIYDEVQSGTGLTGTMWAYQAYGMVPDIVCFGKKMQVCGIFATSRLDEVDKHTFKEASRINSTWGGSLCDMVRAQRYLEIIHEDNLVDNAAKVGAYFLEGIKNLVADYSENLSNARGQGLMCAFDALEPAQRDAIFTACFDRNLLLLKCGVKSLRIRPSLTFSQDEADRACEILRTAVKDVLG